MIADQDQSGMKKFFRYAVFTTLFTYLLIFVGGLVRVSGAGLGCPDWPKCFDRWIPPTSLDQLPSYIDPGSFNITLAWIEYGNRLFGMTTGILILILAVWSLKFWSRSRQVTMAALAALILTGFNGWLGSIVVESLLSPHIITIHMLLALTTVATLIYTAQRIYYLQNSAVIDLPENSKTIGRLILSAGIVFLVEIVIGTELRSGLEMIAGSFPIHGADAWLDALGPIKYIHSLIGFALLGSVVHLVFSTRKAGCEDPLHFLSRILLVLIVMQVVLGEIMIFKSLPGLVRLWHLWVAAIMLGILQIMYFDYRHRMRSLS